MLDLRKRSAANRPLRKKGIYPLHIIMDNIKDATFAEWS